MNRNFEFKWCCKTLIIIIIPQQFINSPFRDYHYYYYTYFFQHLNHIQKINSAQRIYLEDHQSHTKMSGRSVQHPTEIFRISTALYRDIRKIKSVLPRSLECFNSPCQDIRNIISALPKYPKDQQCPPEISGHHRPTTEEGIQKINSALQRYLEDQKCYILWVLIVNLSFLIFRGLSLWSKRSLFLGYSLSQHQYILMAMSIVKKDPWDGTNKYLTSWIKQLEENFILEGITEDWKKVVALLTYVGRYGYEILKNLVPPQKPSESNLNEELSKLLTDHVIPKPVVMVERHKFAQTS